MSAREKGAEPRKKRKRPARKRMIAVVSVLAIAAIAVAVFLRLQGQLDSGELIAEAEQQFTAGDFRPRSSISKTSSRAIRRTPGRDSFSGALTSNPCC